MDRYSNRAYLSIQGSVAWVNRRLLTATGCSAHPLPGFRAGTDDKLAASGQAVSSRHERGYAATHLGYGRMLDRQAMR